MIVGYGGTKSGKVYVDVENFFSKDVPTCEDGELVFACSKLLLISKTAIVEVDQDTLKKVFVCRMLIS